MTKQRKVELLYSKAKGMGMSASPEEVRELRKYRVDAGEGNFYTTKANMKSYVEAVDSGSIKSFADWCLDNGKADRRRSGSDSKSILGRTKEQNLAAVFIGWLTWGVAVYWIFGSGVSVGACAVIGAVIAFVLYKTVGRKWGMVTLILLPVVLAVVAYNLRG